MRYIITFIFYCVINVTSFAQEDTLEQKTDSIHIMKGGEEEKIMQDIREFSQHDNILSQLLGRIMVEPAEKLDQWDFSYREYERYEGKFIRNITVNTREVFSPDPADTTYQPNLIEKAGDFFHVKTRDWIVRNQLLFKSGDQLFPFKLAETERILRSRNYLFDADVRVISAGKDSVDVIVTTRDLWSLSPGLAWDNSDNAAAFSVKENNFLGFGFTTTLGLVVGDPYQPRGWNYYGAMRFENLFAQYLHFDLVRDVDQEGIMHRIRGERRFETPLIDYAGGIDFQWFDKTIHLITQDSLLLSNQNFRSQEYWLGYGTSLFNQYSFQNEYYAGVSFKNREYRNQNHEMSSRYFQDNSWLLAKVGYAFRRYKKTRFVVGLGRNEDIPVGQVFSITGGYLRGIRQNKWYAGVKSGYSLFRKEFGYFSFIAEAGSFLYNQGFNEYTYRIDLLYFTNLYKIGNFRFRHFLGLEFSAIEDPNQLNNAVHLDGQHGIRGFNLSLFGNKKALINYEINLFPPLRFLGFNFAGVGFMDLGFLANRGEAVWEGRFFSGMGLGFKVRNENLIFQSIQIMMGYYPQGAFASPQYNLFLQQRDFYNFEAFRFEKPGIVRF